MEIQYILRFYNDLYIMFMSKNMLVICLTLPTDNNPDENG